MTQAGMIICGVTNGVLSPVLCWDDRFVRRQCNKKEGVEEHRDKATAAMESGGATDEEVKERR